MIAARQVYPQVNDQDVQQQFLEMLPTIRYVASFAFRRRPRLVREELMSEVVANCFVAFRRLVARGKADLAYASALAWYAVRQVRQGRRVGNRCQVRDVLSPDRKRKGFRVEPLGKLLPDGHWQELVVEDQHSTPADMPPADSTFGPGYATSIVVAGSWRSSWLQVKRRRTLPGTSVSARPGSVSSAGN
jgi:hypothetical protein